MARKVVLQSVCDVCQESEASGTFRFGWDLVNYEIDLCGPHADQLTEVMEAMASSARRMGAPARSVEVPTPPPHPRDLVSTPDVREWAKKSGIAISERGRIPDEVFEKYLAARSAGTQSSEGEQRS